MFFEKDSLFTNIICRSIRPSEIIKRNITIFLVSVKFSILNNRIEDALSKHEINQIRKDKKSFLILDYSKEGYSYTSNFNYYNAIKEFCISTGIDGKKIFYISSNLFEDQEYYKWNILEKNNFYINVLAFCYWLDHVKTHLYLDIDLNKIISSYSKNNIFLSLNRRIKPFRTLTISKIFNSKIYNKTAISFDKIYQEDILRLESLFDLKIENYSNLITASPKFLDTNSFEKELSNTVTTDLFFQTLISLVSETLYEQDTGIFYSEKTFKPMCFYHPVCIFGQPNANASLEILGFKLYDKYFDLSFDSILFPVERLDKQILMLENLEKNLISKDQQIEWLLSDLDTLEHNKQAIQDNCFNKQQGLKFLEMIDAAIV